MRRIAIVLLSLGVFAGYGSALGRASWYARHGGQGSCHGGWQSRYDRDDRDDGRLSAPAPAAAPIVAPAAPAQTVVLQAPAAPAPVFIVVPQGNAPTAPQTFVLQPQAAPVQAVAPAAVNPTAGQ